MNRGLLWTWRHQAARSPNLNCGEAPGLIPCYSSPWGRSTLMSTTTGTNLAAHVITTLREHQAELRRAGIRHLSLFGSVAGAMLNLAATSILLSSSTRMLASGCSHSAHWNGAWPD